jgi:catechol 2,3-dioxygenase-like lactoylglutathione lyase family enzyme
MSEPLPIVAVNHVGITSRRVAESRKFYREVLGFREVSRPNFDFEGAWLFQSGLMIHIIRNDQIAEGASTISGRVQHLALTVNDLEKSERLLQEHGVPYLKSEIKDRAIKQIFFHDPDGNTVEIAVYPPLPPFI